MGFLTDSLTNAITGRVTDAIIKDVGKLVGGSSSKNTSSTTTTPTSSTVQNQSSSSDFDAILKQFLAPNKENPVSEQALFAAVVGERVTELKGDKGAIGYAISLISHEHDLAHGSTIPYEAAATASLKELRDNGTLDKAEADQIYSEAFAASQLDSDPNSLANDTGNTSSAESADSATSKAKAKIQALISDPSTLEIRSLDDIPPQASEPTVASASAAPYVPRQVTRSTQTPAHHNKHTEEARGLTIRPLSKGGTMAILLNNRETAVTDSISIVDTDGTKLETQTQSSSARNGRGVFRFTKAGSEYPRSFIVQVKHLDGSMRKIKISNKQAPV